MKLAGLLALVLVVACSSNSENIDSARRKGQSAERPHADTEKQSTESSLSEYQDENLPTEVNGRNVKDEEPPIVVIDIDTGEEVLPGDDVIAQNSNSRYPRETIPDLSNELENDLGENWKTLHNGASYLRFSLYAERAVYRRNSDGATFIRLRLQNRDNRPIGVNLRDRSDIFRVRRWDTTNPDDIIIISGDARRLSPPPLTHIQQKWMLEDFRDGLIDRIDPEETIDFYTTTFWNGDVPGRILTKEIVETLRPKYLFFEFEGSLLLCDSTRVWDGVRPINTRSFAVDASAEFKTFPEDSGAILTCSIYPAGNPWMSKDSLLILEVPLGLDPPYASEVPMAILRRADREMMASDDVITAMRMENVESSFRVLTENRAVWCLAALVYRSRNDLPVRASQALSEIGDKHVVPALLLAIKNYLSRFEQVKDRIREIANTLSLLTSIAFESGIELEREDVEAAIELWDEWLDEHSLALD
ncbi:MAG: hypothetical protein NUW37_12945 [Planctomycetes bacterium]|nr:hypothetical protein [Planctomycetota bacterium]